MRGFMALMAVVGLLGCDRFKKPSTQECKAGVSNLVRYAVRHAIDKEFPNDDDNFFGGLAKGVGTGILTEALADDQKVAWCEVNMSKHEANCLRAAQSEDAVLKCAISIDSQGNLTK